MFWFWEWFIILGCGSIYGLGWWVCIGLCINIKTPIGLGVVLLLELGLFQDCIDSVGGLNLEPCSLAL